MTDELTPIKGRIVRIIDDHTVVLNVGRNDGVEGTIRFGVYTPYETIVDPETDENLGQYRRRKGVVVVQEIAPRFCIAAAPAITEKVVEEIGGLLGFGNHRKRSHTVTTYDLDVDRDDIAELATGYEVRVGDAVEQLVKRPA